MISSSSSITTYEVDAESQQTEFSHAPHWKLLVDRAGVTDAVLNHKYPGQGTEESPYVVDFLPQDSSNPLTYPASKKWTITVLQALATLAVTFVSTAYSGGVFEVIRYFGISTTVATLGISLFVFGFAVGPLLWAPLSEFYGRQIIFFISYAGVVAFSAGAAGAQNIEALVILRFFAGAFGASPLTNSGGVIADMFNANERGPASGIFAMAPFLGPSIGPIVGGFLGDAEGWRWIQGLMAIFTGVLWIACTFYVPETYAPFLLRKRAQKLSTLTGKVYVSKMDLAMVGGASQTKAAQIKTALVRPWILLFKEPIVLLTSIYVAIVYGTLYMLFAAFPIVFQLNRHWGPGIGGLAFCGVAVGMILAVVLLMGDNKRYVRVAAASPNGVAPPEARLPGAIVGSVLLPAGLFWFAWTNGPEIHWIVPIIASAVFSAGIVCVFLSLLGYLIDSYTVYAASVLAANAVLRSLFGAAFPLFTSHMYKDLGIHWASAVPAFLALACLPFPLLFYKYGATIRAKCKYATEAAVVMERMLEQHEDCDPVHLATEGFAEQQAQLRLERREVLSEDETVTGDVTEDEREREGLKGEVTEKKKDGEA